MSPFPSERQYFRTQWAFMRGTLRVPWPVAALLGALLLAACSAPAPSKRSFMQSAEGVRASANVPVGLNPLGSLDTCRPGAMPTEPANRVLVSRPEDFTREASQMISALREALSDPKSGVPPVEFWLAPGRIESIRQARQLGRDCGAVIVLWEPGETKTLELTLPEPAEVPLRDLVQERLCEFGDHTEQVNILYLTIAGLLSLRENEYDKAVLNMNAARTIDTHCFHLPGSGPAAPPDPK
ncbi:MAG TPA: hypothetical protein VKB51_03240 [bacterium]|nr:hypothetical protein [bacterium]